MNAILEKTMSSGYICENEWKEMVTSGNLNVKTFFIDEGY